MNRSDTNVRNGVNNNYHFFPRDYNFVSEKKSVIPESYIHHTITELISYKFIDVINVLNPQYNYQKLEMAQDEIILLQVRKLRLRIFCFIVWFACL